MNKVVLVSCAIFAVLVACAGSQQISHKPNNKDVFIAWNEDTANSVELELKMDSTFSYKVTGKYIGQNKTEYYKGTFSVGRDTLFLSYNENRQPPGFIQFLLAEVQGQYYIQNFSDGRKRMFLKIYWSGWGRHGLDYQW